VEVKIGSEGAKCIGRNGVFQVETMCVEDLCDGTASIGFVSSKLKRRINAGAVIPVSVMDKIAKEWLHMRGLDLGKLPEKGEIKQYAKTLEGIAKNMLEMLEGI
jgi:hypothetical protein